MGRDSAALAHCAFWTRKIGAWLWSRRWLVLVATMVALAILFEAPGATFVGVIVASVGLGIDLTRDQTRARRQRLVLEAGVVYVVELMPGTSDGSGNDGGDGGDGGGE